MRPRRDGRRTRRHAALLRRKPRARPAKRARTAARRLRHGAVGQSQGTRRNPRSGAQCSAEGRMNAPARIEPRLDVRGHFPGIENWHYLDSAATAQKPQAVIDAITQAYSRDYATVHRGVYERSASMTVSYEAARAAASNLIGGQPNELIFTRGATEAINLVARTF